ncbi:MAG TPA: HAD family hydrolase [Blastocatellia bacterium]|nr:HAD family hydrolase [Blastocatellia bacterium]
MSLMKNTKAKTRLLPVSLAIVVLCVPVWLTAQNGGIDPLPSWRDGPAKHAILEFVHQVTDKSGPGFVKPEERIATFDDDGTLWPEWPRHINQIQIVFARQRVEQMAKNHKEWKYQAPFKAILDDDDKELEKDLSDLWNRLDLLRATHDGMTVDEFKSTVRNFVATARHPKFKVPYTQVAYLPMLELLALLRANEFKVYIVTSGGADFIRELSEQVFGVPRECVIGSTPEYEYRETSGEGYLVRKPNVETFNDKSAKAENIQLHIGRRPILAAGNSDGDLAMLGLTAGGKKPFLNLLVRHDDEEREFAYDSNSAKALEKARSNGWTTISMKNDFKVVFSFHEE